MMFRDLDFIEYRKAWALQDELRENRIAGAIPDTILLLEHPPVFTLGRKDCGEDLITPEAEIRAEGIDIVKTNRGGRVTYHGPGQLVAYFICNIEERRLGIKDLVRAIEESCIGLLAGLGIEAGRDDKHPGIWVGRAKIVAIGLNVQHGVTQHGLALNVDCDLSPYRHIVACGIQGRGVTSIAKERGKALPMAEVKAQISRHLERSLAF